MSHALNKRQKIEQIYQILRDYPDGLTQSELARKLDVYPSTIKKYLDQGDLPYVYEEEDGSKRLKLNPDIHLFRLGFNFDEITMLHIAARLLVRQTNQHNPYAASALRKLAEVIEKADQNISQHLASAASQTDSYEQILDKEFIATLHVLTEARTKARKVTLEYELENGDWIPYTFAPYFIEPYAPGLTTHVIGKREPPNVIRTFKIERLRNARLTHDAFVVDPDFDPQALLEHAWGIWYTDRAPELVELKFAPRVKRRVMETRWHRHQAEPEVLDDDSVIWRCRIAEPKEMLYWIRGWGADVEVLKPEWLRRELERAATDLGKLYQIEPMTKFAYHLPYAKTNPDNENEVHLLLYHLIDVGQVALAIWQSVLTKSIKQRLADTLGLSVIQTGQFIAFIAALHDLGKAFPGYQKKYGPSWLQAELKKAGLGLDGITGDSYKKEFPHGTVSTWALTQLLPEVIGLDAAFAEQIAVAIGGHHGSWPPPGTTERLDDRKYPRWDEIRRDLVWEVQAVFQPPTNVTFPVDKSERNTFLTLLSGLVSVADWLGSRNKECFEFIGEPMSTRQYAARAAQNAYKSLQDLGWLGWQPNGQTRTFAEAFAYLNFSEPRGVQAEVIAAAQDLKSPTLLIVEAPTGIGKTEIALYLADRWLQQQSGRGLYVAMPTQATSNQMYERIGEFLHKRYPDLKVNYHLVHGQAAWLDELKEKIELQGIGDDATAGILAESWFTPRKRTLLAPFGVGTVDQTLMSILQTHHFFVRLFGLSHKVVIFDEVHAYDTFMSTLFHRLLEWLNAIGTSVIILSATLPKATRRQLVEAYSGQQLPDKLTYPALTIATPGSAAEVIALAKPDDVTLHLSWEVGREPAEILSYLQKELRQGGCVAVICNTVGRAQAIYGVLEKACQKGDLDIGEDDLILFHARFPPVWRQAIEKKVLDKFGKPNQEKPDARPHKAIVVATQVIEQSLDLDFDLMLTDLSPIDLMIQRVGRLHRHDRDAKQRHGHTRRLVITEPPQDAAGIPDFGSDEWVYEPFILLRSYLALQGQKQIDIPSDTTDLIEAVYADSPDVASLAPHWQEALRIAQKEMDDNRHKAKIKAGQQLVMAPNNSRLLKQRNANLDEESPAVHETFRAQTRDIDPGIALVCLHREGESLIIHTKEGKKTINLQAAVPRNLIKHLQQNTITVQHKGLVHHFVDQQPPTSWQKEAALRHCRPVVFDGGHYDDPNLKYVLHLSPKFGLEIIKKEDR